MPRVMAAQLNIDGAFCLMLLIKSRKSRFGAIWGRKTACRSQQLQGRLIRNFTVIVRKKRIYFVFKLHKFRVALSLNCGAKYTDLHASKCRDTDRPLWSALWNYTTFRHPGKGPSRSSASKIRARKKI